MKIVILDGYAENPGDLSWDEFKTLGDLIVYERTPSELIRERIGEAEIVLTNKTPITKSVMEQCANLRYIGVLATGYNVVDVNQAKIQGVTVTNIPSYGTEAVSQFVFALLLEIAHHVGHHSKEVFKGRWQSSPDWCFWDYPLIELSGKTMGIIGHGRIGKTTGKIAQAFGMKVLVNTRTPEKELENERLSFVDLDELYEKSDVIVLHCPLLPTTEHMINKESIKKMKDGVILINNSRGPLIEEQDLYEALESGKVYAAGVDVVSSEPIQKDNPLLKARNLFITPHISWAPKETRKRLMEIAVGNLKAFLDEKPVNVVF
ncbi:MAG TPA: D-2-hydroxyacid dehydrogenase [Proteiniclasticum sp.]|nr:D-2-hydroxyacid dehydrogenase [Proteiniclasticum sp.]